MLYVSIPKINILNNKETKIENVKFSEIETIIKYRWGVCHASKPTFDGFEDPPLGVVFDTPDDIIKDLLGDELFESLFGPGKELDGYSLSAFQLNGAEIDASAIQNIINNINQGNSQVIDITVE